MNFRLNEEEVKFREEIRQFLKEEPPDQFPLDLEDSGFGMGGWSKAYHRRMGARGWIGIMVPKEHGGKGYSPMKEFIFYDEMAYHIAPVLSRWSAVSAGIEPLLGFGSEEQIKEYVPGLLNGEITFYMGMSEPESGSDLLALRTTARLDGDDYVINGQKIWSSNGHLVDYGLMLVRTDPDAPRHKGISAIIVDLKTPGVTVANMIDMAGDNGFNEVFFDDVRVPKRNLVGRPGDGFGVTLSLLDGDRVWGRCGRASMLQRYLDELISYLKQTGQEIPANARHQMAELAVEIEVCRMLSYQGVWLLDRGLDITYETAMLKLFADELGQRFSWAAIQLMGLHGQLAEGTQWAPLKGAIEHMYLVTVGHTIAGGTSEIIRNTIATRGLGLPR